jgi:hypothetical protein
VSVGHKTFDLTPWARRVHELSGEVLAGGGGEYDSARRLLLSYVLDDAARASALSDQGVEDLVGDDPLLFGEAVEFLQTSARRPVTDEAAAAALRARVDALIGPVVARHERGWDVTPAHRGVEVLGA